LLLSLSMDGLTGAIQERMRASSAPSAQYMMLSMNSWSTLFLVPALLVTGEGMDFIAFANRHPKMLTDLGTLALAGAFGQLFIFMMVADFGPLPCSIVTTTRKFFTVLFSVIFFGNSLTSRQWMGTVLVFTGLFADMIIGKKPQSKGQKLLSADKK
jgi:solute carrier family 35 (UDP-galactose transporter), member B1